MANDGTDHDGSETQSRGQEELKKRDGCLRCGIAMAYLWLKDFRYGWACTNTVYKSRIQVCMGGGSVQNWELKTSGVYVTVAIRRAVRCEGHTAGDLHNVGDMLLMFGTKHLEQDC